MNVTKEELGVLIRIASGDRTLPTVDRSTGVLETLDDKGLIEWDGHPALRIGWQLTDQGRAVLHKDYREPLENDCW